VIGMAGAGLAGAGLMSGRASAGGQQVGTIGDKDATPAQRVDVHSEDIDNSDTITTNTLDATTVTSDSLSSNNTTTDSLNTASISSAVAGEALQSDGSGNLQFAPTGGGGIVLESGDSITVATVDGSATSEAFETLYSGSAKDVLGGVISGRRANDFLYEFSDGSTIRKGGPGTAYSTENLNRNADANGDFQEIDFLPPAKDVVKIEVGTRILSNVLLAAEVILKD
jgi:hypothetical protein